MDADERMKRPTLERTRPIRSWSALFEQPGNSRAQGDRTQGPEGFDDVVTRSVDLAYRVIDDYLRRGQEAACRLRGGEPGARALGAEVPDLAARVVRFASDLAATWAEFLELMVRDGARGGATEEDIAPAEPSGSVPAATPGVPIPPLRLRVRLDAASEVDVALDLITMPTTLPVTVHALRAPSGDRPRLEDVSMAADRDGVATLELHLPADQPPGSYEGLLVEDSANRPLGRLTVSIRNPR